MRKKLFVPVIDNGMGLSRTTWAMSLAASCLTVLREYDVILDHVSYPYPDGAMNVATSMFLGSGADEMIVIDTDVVFRPNQLAYLFEHDEQLVFGLYPRKQLGLVFPMELLGDENPFSVNPFAEGVAPLVEVKRVARGFMRVHRSVFEEMKEYAPEYVDAPTGRTLTEFWKCLPGGHSEDFNFCDRWRSMGGRILIDQRATVQHEGTALFPIPGTF